MLPIEQATNRRVLASICGYNLSEIAQLPDGRWIHFHWYDQNEIRPGVIEIKQVVTGITSEQIVLLDADAEAILASPDIHELDQRVIDPDIYRRVVVQAKVSTGQPLSTAVWCAFHPLDPSCE